MSRGKGKQQLRETLCFGWFYSHHPALPGSKKKYLDFNLIFYELLLRGTPEAVRHLHEWSWWHPCVSKQSQYKNFAVGFYYLSRLIFSV